jgi:P27 family predicted phage terminase small subunit
MATRLPPAPPHLSAESQRWWRQIVRLYELEPHHLRLLQSACECWDRVLQARAAIERDGPYYRDRFEQIRPHPALAEERASKTLMARLLRELALDIEPPADVGRPPAIPPGAGRRVR